MVNQVMFAPTFLPLALSCAFAHRRDILPLRIGAPAFAGTVAESPVPIHAPAQATRARLAATPEMCACNLQAPVAITRALALPLGSSQEIMASAVSGPPTRTLAIASTHAQATATLARPM